MPRTPETTYKIMSAIKSKDTIPEQMLGRAMWKQGLRYRKQYKLPGKPDFAFVKAKLAVFCDGDFWHGNNWKIRGLSSLNEELEGYSEFWQNKITTNIERDIRNNKKLQELGWQVIRLWESDIKKNSEKCAKKVKRIHSKRLERII